MVKARFVKLCIVDVKTPEGGEYQYSFRSKRSQGTTNCCSSLTPGTILTIEEGKIVTPWD